MSMPSKTFALLFQSQSHYNWNLEISTFAIEVFIFTLFLLNSKRDSP